MNKDNDQQKMEVSFPQINTLIWVVLVIGLVYFLVQTTSKQNYQADRADMRGQIAQCGESLGYTQTAWFKQNFSNAGNLADMNYVAQKSKWPADFTKCVDEKTE